VALYISFVRHFCGMPWNCFTLLYLTMYNISELCGNNRFLSPTSGFIPPLGTVSVVVLLCFGNGGNESDCEVVQAIQNQNLSFCQEKCFFARDV